MYLHTMEAVGLQDMRNLREYYLILEMVDMTVRRICC